MKSKSTVAMYRRKYGNLALGLTLALAISIAGFASVKVLKNSKAASAGSVVVGISGSGTSYPNTNVPVSITLSPSLVAMYGGAFRLSLSNLTFVSCTATSALPFTQTVDGTPCSTSDVSKDFIASNTGNVSTAPGSTITVLNIVVRTASTTGTGTISLGNFDFTDYPALEAMPTTGPSKSITVQTPTPTTPTGLTSSSIQSTSVAFSWTPSTAVGGNTLASYNVYRGGVLVRNVTVPNITDTGLTAGTSYSYTVEAVDSAGNKSALSTALAVSTTSLATPTLGIVTPTLNSSGILDNTRVALVVQLSITNPSNLSSLTATVNGASSPVSSNTVTLPNLNGDYVIVVSGTNLVNSQPLTSTITVKVRHPDINRSGRVDFSDIAQLLQKWNLVRASNGFNPAVDLNDDGRSNFSDLSIILQKWNQ